MGISECDTSERNEKALEKVAEILHDSGSAPRGTFFYRMNTGRAAHYENIKPQNPSTEEWCIPADEEEGGLSDDGPCLRGQ